MRTGCVALFIALALLSSSWINAQQVSTNDAFARLRASVQQMTSTLPDLICHQQVTSIERVHGKIKMKGDFGYQITVTQPAKAGEDFPEKRTLLSYDGKPIDKHREHYPIFNVTDGFGASFTDDLSPTAGRCLLYSSNATTVDGINALEVQIRVNPKDLALKVCRIYKHDPKGNEVFDLSLSSGRLLHFHAYFPYTELSQWKTAAEIPKIIYFRHQALRPASVATETNYESVKFGPDLTVIPAEVDATATPLKHPNIEYTYKAVNSECHRFLATVTLLPYKTTP